MNIGAKCNLTTDFFYFSNILYLSKKFNRFFLFDLCQYQEGRDSSNLINLQPFFPCDIRQIFMEGWVFITSVGSFYASNPVNANPMNVPLKFEPSNPDPDPINLGFLILFQSIPSLQNPTQSNLILSSSILLIQIPSIPILLIHLIFVF